MKNYNFYQKTRSSSGSSLTDLTNTGTSIHRTPEKVTEPDIDTSHLSCSPFTSPLHDITQEFNRSINLGEQIEHYRKDTVKTYPSSKEKNSSFEFKNIKNQQLRNKENELSVNMENECSTKDSTKTYSTSKENELKNKVLNNLKVRSEWLKKFDDDDEEVTFIGSIDAVESSRKNLKVIDDDVTIVETKPEVIALSSDDEEEVRRLHFFFACFDFRALSLLLQLEFQWPRAAALAVHGRYFRF